MTNLKEVIYTMITLMQGLRIFNINRYINKYINLITRLLE